MINLPDINKIGYNSIPEQNLTYANQLTVRDWNIIINSLKMQTNATVDYLRRLHQWLNVINTNFNVLTSGYLITSVSYNTSSQSLILNYLNGTSETIEMGSGNANIYYDDTLPQDVTKIKSGDLYFDEQ